LLEMTGEETLGGAMPSAAAAGTAPSAAGSAVASDASSTIVKRQRKQRLSAKQIFDNMAAHVFNGKTSTARNMLMAMASANNNTQRIWFPDRPSQFAGSAVYVAEQISRGLCNMASLDSPSCIGSCLSDAEVDAQFKTLFSTSAEVAKMNAELKTLTTMLGTEPHSAEAFYLTLEFFGQDLTPQVPTLPIKTTINMIFSGFMFSIATPIVYSDPIVLLDTLTDLVTNELRCHLRFSLGMRVLENFGESCTKSLIAKQHPRPQSCLYDGTPNMVDGLFYDPRTSELVTDYMLAGEDVKPTRSKLGNYWVRDKGTFAGCPKNIPTSCAAAAKNFLSRYPRLAKVSFTSDPKDIWAFYKSQGNQTITFGTPIYQWLGLTCQRCESGTGLPWRITDQYLPVTCMPGAPVHTVDVNLGKAAAKKYALPYKSGAVSLTGFHAEQVAVSLGNHRGTYRSVRGPFPSMPGLTVSSAAGVTFTPALPLSLQWTIDVYVSLPLAAAAT